MERSFSCPNAVANPEDTISRIEGIERYIFLSKTFLVQL